MKKLGYIIPNYPHEKRVALLPKDVKKIPYQVVIEKGFGMNLGYSDEDYIKHGAICKSREEVYAESDFIFSLKLIQETDYDLIKEGSVIIGWIHPNGSGQYFYETQVKNKDVVIFDIDSTGPFIYSKNNKIPMPNIQKNFLWYNSYLAGKASVYHALQEFSVMPDANMNIAVLSPGNVAQGAFNILSKLGAEPRMFSRSNMHQFIETIDTFDIIVNGIEVFDNTHIIDEKNKKRIKKGALVIDAAADAGGAIENTRFTSMDEPIFETNGVYYYCVNNSPSIFYKDISKNLSEVLTQTVYQLDFEKLAKEVKEV